MLLIYHGGPLRTDYLYPPKGVGPAGLRRVMARAAERTGADISETLHASERIGHAARTWDRTARIGTTSGRPVIRVRACESARRLVIAALKASGEDIGVPLR